MATLNALKKAPIVNEVGVQLDTRAHTITSSDTAVAKITTSNYTAFLTGITGGHVTVTATRALDGAIATLEVDVLEAVPFSIGLGAELPA